MFCVLGMHDHMGGAPDFAEELVTKATAKLPDQFLQLEYFPRAFEGDFDESAFQMMVKASKSIGV